MKLSNLFFLFIIFNLFSCKRSDIDLSAGCVLKAQVNDKLFKEGPSDHLMIQNVELMGDCLTIEFGAGGCSGRSWELDLVGTESSTKDRITQRSIRLSLKNPELCEAWFTQSISFDISGLKVSKRDVILNLDGYDTPILYKK